LKTKAFSNLEDVFGSKTASFEIQNETLFRIKPFLVGIQPQNLREFCRSFCEPCATTFSFDQVRQLCPSCFKEGKPVFEVVLYLKDEHSLSIDEVYKVYYYSPLDEDMEDPLLFGFAPCNLYKDPKALARLEQTILMLSQFNVFMDLAIEGQFNSQTRQNVFRLFEGQVIARVD